MPDRPIPFDQPVFVTRPLLPPLEGFVGRLRDVWSSGWLANGGAQHQALERALSEHLRCAHLSLFNNGTIGLIVACQAVRLSGEVITTPFSFPATPHVLSWNNVTPVFADVEPGTMNLDPAAIEPLITARTTGILGVHVYGTPCQVDEVFTLSNSQEKIFCTNHANANKMARCLRDFFITNLLVDKPATLRVAERTRFSCGCAGQTSRDP